MSHRNPLGADPVRHLLKQPVASQPPGFLDPGPEPPGNRAYPGAADSNRQVQTAGQPPDECGIIRRLRSQHVVEVHYVQLQVMLRGELA
jgi:hypothetical protein